MSDTDFDPLIRRWLNFMTIVFIGSIALFVWGLRRAFALADTASSATSGEITLMLGLLVGGFLLTAAAAFSIADAIGDQTTLDMRREAAAKRDDPKP